MTAMGSGSSQPARKRISLAFLIGLLCFLVGYFAGREHIKYEIRQISRNLAQSALEGIGQAFSKSFGASKPSSLAADQERTKQREEREYLQYVKLENIKVGQGYGQFDVPGYSNTKPSVSATLRNIGDRTLRTVRVTVYFLDKDGHRIGEKSYSPVSGFSFDDDSPLKSGYVRDFGYLIGDDAPSTWANKVEVEITEVEFLDPTV